MILYIAISGIWGPHNNGGNQAPAVLAQTWHSSGVSSSLVPAGADIAFRKLCLFCITGWVEWGLGLKGLHTEASKGLQETDGEVLQAFKRHRPETKRDVHIGMKSWRKGRQANLSGTTGA